MIKKIATSIVELFEDLLDEHGIIIPDDDRPADNDAPLYGCTYGNLVDDVSDVIISALNRAHDGQKDKMIDIVNEDEGENKDSERPVELGNLYLSVTSKMSAIDTVLQILQAE